jgi:hypothetical protein
MAMRIRLKESAFVDNHRYERGDIVTLPDGVRGPHRTVRQADERFFNGNLKPEHYRILAERCDEPLFEILSDQAI